MSCRGAPCVGAFDRGREMERTRLCGADSTAADCTADRAAADWTADCVVVCMGNVDTRPPLLEG